MQPLINYVRGAVPRIYDPVTESSREIQDSRNILSILIIAPNLTLGTEVSLREYALESTKLLIEILHRNSFSDISFSINEPSALVSASDSGNMTTLGCGKLTLKPTNRVATSIVLRPSPEPLKFTIHSQIPVTSFHSTMPFCESFFAKSK